MSPAQTRSLADIEAELWNPGPLLDFAYYYDVERYQISPLRSHKVSEKLLAGFKDQLDEARGRKLTGRPLSDALGKLGEYFAAIVFGLKLHKDPHAEGSDGRLGDDFVEVKTITPTKKRDVVSLSRDRNFNKIVVVKITSDFQFGARMVHRRILKAGDGMRVYLSWNDMIAGCGPKAMEVHCNFPIVKAMG